VNLQHNSFRLKEGNRVVGTIFYVNLHGGCFLTNSHNVVSRRYIEVQCNDVPMKFYVDEAENIPIESLEDFCLLKWKRMPLEGMKPLKVAVPTPGLEGLEGCLFGFDPKKNWAFTATPCKWRCRVKGLMIHNASTDFGSCGSVLVNGRGEIVGVHSTGQGGDRQFPNEAVGPYPSLNL
jgi:hypothetical protein